VTLLLVFTLSVLVFPPSVAAFQLTGQQREQVTRVLEQATILLEPAYLEHLQDDTVEKLRARYAMAKLAIGDDAACQDLAEATEGRHRQKLFHQIVVSRVEQLRKHTNAGVRSGSQGTGDSATFEQFRELGANCDESFFYSELHRPIKRMLDDGHFQLAAEVVHALGPDLRDWKVGANRRRDKYRINAIGSIAVACHENGKVLLANEMIEKFNHASARDIVRIRLHAGLLRRSGQESAKSIANDMETLEGRFQAELKKAETAIESGDLPLADDSLGGLERLFDELQAAGSDSNVRFRYGNFLLALIAFHAKEGRPADALLVRIIEFAKGDRVLERRVEVAAMQLERFDLVDANPVKISSLISELASPVMLHGGVSGTESMIGAIPYSQRIELAVGLANSLDHSLFRAALLVDIAKHLARRDLTKASQLLDQAWLSVRQSGPSRLDLDFSPLSFERALNSIAEAALVCDRRDLAFEIAGRASTAFPMTVAEGFNKSQSQRIRTVLDRADWSEERLYRERDGEAIFEMLAQLKGNVNRGDEIRHVGDAAGIFARLGMWPQVEQFLQICKRDFHGRIPVSDELFKELIRRDDEAATEKFLKLHATASQPRILSRLCRYYNSSRYSPDEEMVQVIDRLAREIDARSEKPALTLGIFILLIAGHWDQGKESQANEWIARMDAPPYGAEWLGEQIRDANFLSGHLIALSDDLRETAEETSSVNRYLVDLAMLYLERVTEVETKVRVSEKLGVILANDPAAVTKVDRWLPAQNATTQALVRLNHTMEILKQAGIRIDL